MNRLIRQLLALTAMTLAVPCAAADVPQATATATLHDRSAGPTYDRRIFGQFAEMLGTGIYGGLWVGRDSVIPNDGGFRRDAIVALKALHVPFVRWPGGCFADTYRWRDGVGPVRRAGINSWWGGTIEPSSFGTHEYFDLLERIGADAYISANVGSAPPGETAEWLHYVTDPVTTSLGAERAANGHPAPWSAAMIGVGNELWGCGGNLRAEAAADITLRYATFARGSGAAPLKLASGPSEDDVAWTDAMMRIAGKQIDGLSLHYYTLVGSWQDKAPALGFSRAQWFDSFAKTRVMDKLLTVHSAVMDKYDPGKVKLLAVDEWGMWHHEEKGVPALYQQNSLRDALIASVNLDIFARHADRVKISAIAQMVNVLQSMLLTDGPTTIRTPTYWTYFLYLPWQDSTVIPLDIRSPDMRDGARSQPALSMSAVRDKKGRRHVALTNVDPDRALPVTLAIDGGAPRHLFGRVLSADRMDAHNDAAHPDAVAPRAFAGARKEGSSVVVTVPAKSLVVLDLD
ncbi:MAG: alpha-L-arabinofuranosidase C-terminal domain-containing protein [Sphingomicrobium sp.]